MTTYLTPETKQTLPGRSRRYRLWTTDHCGWEKFAETGVSLVTCSRWGVSYSHTYGEDTWTLKAYDVSNMPEEGVEHHDVNGQVFDTKEDAQRVAFEAGLLAFMEYLDQR